MSDVDHGLLEMMVTKIIGERVRKMRLARGIDSEAKLARMLGVPTSTISRTEHGKAAGNVYRLIRLAEALHCRITDLLPTPSDYKRLRRLSTKR